MRLAIDSSVIVASVMEKENCHEDCKKLMEKISNGEYAAAAPYSVLVEFAASIRRRTDSEKLCDKVVKDLKNINTLSFLELTAKRADEAAEIAKKTGLKGMDAIVVQTAMETGALLVTLDGEITEKAKIMAETMPVEIAARLKDEYK